jgi:hypothetical protein
LEQSLAGISKQRTTPNYGGNRPIFRGNISVGGIPDLPVQFRLERCVAGLSDYRGRVCIVSIFCSFKLTHISFLSLCAHQAARMADGREFIYYKLQHFCFFISNFEPA